MLFGLFMLNEVAFRGAMLHVYFHSVMKNALFLAAGSIIFKTGLTDVRDLKGIGKKMPVTLWVFIQAAWGEEFDSYPCNQAASAILYPDGIPAIYQIKNFALNTVEGTDLTYAEYVALQQYMPYI